MTCFDQFSNPIAIAIDDDGFVYVSNYDPAGKSLYHVTVCCVVQLH